MAGHQTLHKGERIWIESQERITGVQVSPSRCPADIDVDRSSWQVCLSGDRNGFYFSSFWNYSDGASPGRDCKAGDGFLPPGGP
jgi:hypothetical protein